MGIVRAQFTSEDHLVVWYGDAWECECGFTDTVDWRALFHSKFPNDPMPKDPPFRMSG